MRKAYEETPAYQERRARAKAGEHFDEPILGNHVPEPSPMWDERPRVSDLGDAIGRELRLRELDQLLNLN